MLKKVVFTTGEVADLLHIHQTTVIDWVDKGLILSYKTPGGHRRVSRDNLLKFLAVHNMPVPHILAELALSEEGEKHRHLHESFQVNPYSQSKPMEAFPPLPKRVSIGNAMRNNKNTEHKGRVSKKA